MDKNTKLKLLITVVVVALAVWRAYPLEKNINLGLDLQGGMHVVLQVDKSALSKDAQKTAVSRALEIIRRRVDNFGVAEPYIQPQGDDRIIVQLPGVTDSQRAKDMIGKTALLEFKLVSEDQTKIMETMKGNPPPAGYELLQYSGQRSGKNISIPLLVKSESLLTGAHLVEAYPNFGGQFSEPQVAIAFDNEGAEIFAKVTELYFGRKLAIILDGEVLTAPVIQAKIPDGRAVITGNFAIQEAKDLAAILGAGALPAPVKIIEDRTLSPTLGKDSIIKGIRASIVGLILVIIFMAMYYLLGGLIANVALFLNVVLLLGALAFFNATLTLPGIAGIILTIGMAVDANVLIFERMREEFKLGRKIRTVITNGYNKAFITILDSNLTTLITAVILFIFGTGPVKGFAVTLTIGLIASMFTALTVTRMIFDMMTVSPRFNKLTMLQFIGETKIPFIKMRYIAYFISLILVVVGMAAFVMRGRANFGIDFLGGSLVQVHFSAVVPINDVRQVVSATVTGAHTVQQFGEHAGDFLIRFASDDTDTLTAALKEKFTDKPFEILRQEKVGPAVGKDLIRKAIWAFIFSGIAMLFYLAYRFEFIYATAAVIALMHDVLVTVGFLALTGREIDLTVIAAILTLVGYSVNDTIVIFDRIRENLKLYGKLSFPDLVDLSVNATLSRSILTSFMTLLTVVALFLFGGSVINDFAFTLLIGMIAGSYSTIFVASAIVVDWKGKTKVVPVK